MRMPLFFWLMGLLALLWGAVPVGAASESDETVELLLLRPDRVLRTVNDRPLLRDPFNWSREQVGRFRDMEPLIKSNSAAGLTLNAIIWEPDRALAVINDRITAVGDHLQGATVLEIMKEMVIFELDGGYHTLWLDPGGTLPPTVSPRKE